MKATFTRSRSWQFVLLPTCALLAVFVVVNSKSTQAGLVIGGVASVEATRPDADTILIDAKDVIQVVGGSHAVSGIPTFCQPVTRIKLKSEDERSVRISLIQYVPLQVGDQDSTEPCLAVATQPEVVRLQLSRGLQGRALKVNDRPTNAVVVDVSKDKSPSVPGLKEDPGSILSYSATRPHSTRSYLWGERSLELHQYYTTDVDGVPKTGVLRQGFIHGQPAVAFATPQFNDIACWQWKSTDTTLRLCERPFSGELEALRMVAESLE